MSIIKTIVAVAALHTAALAGPILYVTDFSAPHQLGSLDLATGTLTATGTASAGEILNGPGGALYAFDENGAFLRFFPNGTTSLIGSPGFQPDEPAGLADGTIYTTDFATHNLYTINPSTGAALLVGSTGFINPAGSAYVLTLLAGQTNSLYAIATAFDPSFNVVNHSKLYRLDRNTGAATFIANVNDDAVTCAIVISGVGYLFDFTGQVSSLDLSTGAVTPLYDLSASFNGFNGVAIAPEPSALAMMGAGLILVLLVGCGKRETGA